MSYSSSKSLISRKIYVSDGAPTDLSAPTGALCVDTDGPGLYQNTGTPDEPEWSSVVFGEDSAVAWDDITGKPAVIGAGADAAAARAAIGAGTSNLVVGTGATNAKAGNYVPTYAEVTGKPAVIAAGADAAEARAAIGAGTSNLVVGTAATDAKAGNYVPTYAEITGKPAAFPSTATTVTATAISPGTATTVQGILAELAARITALETP